MTAQTWTSLQTSLIAALAQAAPPYTSAISAGFTEQFPQATSYAEQRIYTEIPMLTTRETDTSLTTASGVRTLSLSGMALPVIVQEGLGLLSSGRVYPYDKTTLDAIDLMWQVQTATLAPSAADWVGRYWAPLSDSVIVIAPTPDASYTAYITGLCRPTPISAGNPSTYLSTVYPALLQAACMVFLTGWLIRNWGAQSGDPQMAVSHEAQYQKLMTAAKAEEAMRRGLLPDEPAPAQGGA